ncbi:MAG: hypothetical protein OHK0029_11490 [Armatimonadaceae bacterium]
MTPLHSDWRAKEKPICVALVICNEVIEDKRSGNKTLVGLFNGIMTPQLPATHPRMYLMASLTSGTGEWEFTFVITAPSGLEVFRMKDTARFTDPLVGHDLVVELRNLPLEEAGVYFVDLLIGSTPIANRRFTVQMMSEDNLPRYGGYSNLY